MTNRGLGFVPCTMFAVAVAIAGVASAAETHGDADAILKQFSEQIAAQDAFRLTADAGYELRIDGRSQRIDTVYEIAFRRDDQLSLHVDNPEVEIYFVVSGPELTSYVPEFSQYTVEEFDVDVYDFLGQMGIGATTTAIALLSEIVRDVPFQELDGAATYVGSEIIDGQETDRIQYAVGDRTFDLWFSRGAETRLLRIEPDTSGFEDQFKAEGYDAEVDAQVELKDWSFEGIADAPFAFEPPQGAEKVARFMPPQPEPEANRLLGKTAPEFEIELLDGGTVNIAEKRGKEVVILDFWATWCGPCRQAMPVISRVAKAFADKGVSLYAVNLEEDAETIRQFLKSQGLDVTVALDTDASVADKYLVTGIPQTVIIGKDGTVQAVHVGMLPNLEAELTENLTALVKGESLVD